MPELPEVETVCRGLAPKLEGRRIAKAHVKTAKLRFALPRDFAEKMTGARIMRLTRRAKYLLADMRDRQDNGFYWLSHLGMTGRFTWHETKGATGFDPTRYAHDISNEAAVRHIHLALELDDGSHLTYADPRRFGFMDIIDAALDTNRFLAQIGPEPLGNRFNEAHLLAACENRQTPIKNLLLDQHVVAGLGNIYVCEALFRAGISPRRKAGNLGAKRAARLVPAIRAVLEEAIAAGGSTLRDFAASDGALGYFQHGFAVYDRAGKPCSRDGCNANVVRIVQSGRSSFYCPTCQR
jgi:formamidopyrimidine-DNA glycosylase